MIKPLRHLTFRLLLVLLIVPYICQGQECLSLLDSAALNKTKNRTKALEYLRQLATSLDSGLCDTQIGYAEAYNNTGLLFKELNEKRASIDMLTKAIETKLYRYDSFAIELLPYYDNIYSVYRDYNDYITAGRYLSYAEKTLKNRSNQDLPYLNHLIESGIFYKEIGKLNESAEILGKAKDFINSKSMGDSISGTILIETGSLYTLQGEYDKAERDLNRAITILRANYPALHARAVDRLAKLLMENGDLAQSETRLLSNISFKKNKFPSDTLLLVESLNNLGVLYFRINDIENAKEYFSQMMQLGATHMEIRPFALNNLGVIEMRQGKIDVALGYFNEASKYFASNFGTLHQEYANVLNNLAGAHKLLNDYEQALSYYNQVLELDRILFGADHPKYATTLSNLAFIYRHLGYVEIAEKFIRNATKIKKHSLGDFHHEVARSFDDLGLMELTRGDTLAALHSFDSALYISINHIQNIFPVLTDPQRILAYKEIQHSLKRFSALAFSEHFFSSQWSEKALDYTINTKSILFYTSDKIRRAAQESNNPIINSLYYRWRKQGVDLANAYLLSNSERTAQGISISEMEEHYEKLEKELALRINAVSSQQETAFMHWQEISNAMPDSTALVEIIQYNPYGLEVTDTATVQGFIDQSRYVAFIIKPNEQLERVTWSNQTKFDKQFSYYRNCIRYKITDNLTFDQLWAPIDERVGESKKVYFSADGGWHETNPSAFYDTQAKKYISERYPIVTITSGKDILLSKSYEWSKTAQILGNPDFSVHAKSIELEQLEGAEAEAREINDILRAEKWKTDEYINAKATEETIKNMRSPGVLHIATHGYFNENETDQPLLNSGLYLTTAGKRSTEDGKLTAYEAMNLELDKTLLVVLSACETGLGHVEDGEGVFGLQRAFLTAGAKNLIITLMKINDQATQTFMEMFYREFAESENVESSFFNARMKFKNQYPDPLDWGAFILITKG
jgi:CHAT domain-containing protein/Tfp pilus assembly protein PilF